MKKIFLLLAVVVAIGGCQIEKLNYSTALVYTYEPKNVLTNSASMGGIVIGEGGKNVSEYGIVWSTNSTPTINDNKIVKGSRLGEFFDNYSIFQPSTTYYYAAYAINEEGVGYGKVNSFKTTEEAPCNPTQNNKVNYGLGDLIINGVQVDYPSWTSGDGNIEFMTNSGSSTARIIVGFNEYNNHYPQTGTYTVVNSDSFGGSNSVPSSGEAKLYIQNFGLSFPYSGTAATGTKFYVKNVNNVMTIIFCDTHVGTNILNGKFSKAVN